MTSELHSRSSTAYEYGCTSAKLRNSLEDVPDGGQLVSFSRVLRDWICQIGAQTSIVLNWSQPTVRPIRLLTRILPWGAAGGSEVRRIYEEAHVTACEDAR